MNYKMLKGSHGRFEHGKAVRYATGDEIELSAAEAEALGDRVAPIGPASVTEEPTNATPTEPTEGSTDFSHLADLPWSKAAKIIRELDNPDDVIAAGNAEDAGKKRKAVLAAATKRLEELGGEVEG